jgi:pyridoxine 4-dehydrogenase
MTDSTISAKAGTINLGAVSLARLGLGTNRIHDNEQGHELLKAAIKMGVNFIDTAYVYAGGESEVAIGNALSPYTEGLVIATKGGNGNGASRKQLESELHESLKRLKCEQIDLYQLHRMDPEIPIKDTMAVFKDFQDQGLIKHIGLSEVGVKELDEARSVVEIASIQNEYNVINRKHEDVVDYCTEHNIIFIPWFPLGGLRGDAEIVEQKLSEMSNKHNASAQQIALAWLLKRSPIMLPIPGTTSIQHLEDNLKSADVKLSDDDYTVLNSLAS